MFLRATTDDKFYSYTPHRQKGDEHEKIQFYCTS